tara:strand:+ start:1393 stop:2325 length:933 start_codon:yes stop_codon:yes gene_type:complete
MATIYHTYADANLFREYLAGSGHTADWTEDSTTIRILLEAVSQRINQFVGNRSFGPSTATHSFDIGIGALRSDAIERTGNEVERPDYWANKASGAGRIPLDNWLISPTTVTAYTDTARTSSNVLTEGTSNDFLLEPYNRAPKNLLKLSEDTTKSFSGGQQTLTILGSWGWQDQKSTALSTADAIGSTTTTSVSVSSGSTTYAGYTLSIDTEQLYVQSVSSNTLTVIRGVNGTTAATHSGGVSYYRYEYPSDVVGVALEIARNRWRSREAGTTQLIGSGEASMTRPQESERTLLKRLNYYVGEMNQAGLFF